MAQTEEASTSKPNRFLSSQLPIRVSNCRQLSITTIVRTHFPYSRWMVFRIQTPLRDKATSLRISQLDQDQVTAWLCRRWVFLRRLRTKLLSFPISSRTRTQTNPSLTSRATLKSTITPRRTRNNNSLNSSTIHHLLNSRTLLARSTSITRLTQDRWWMPTQVMNLRCQCHSVSLLDRDE